MNDGFKNDEYEVSNANYEDSDGDYVIYRELYNGDRHRQRYIQNHYLVLSVTAKEISLNMPDIPVLVGTNSIPVGTKGTTTTTALSKWERWKSKKRPSHPPLRRSM
ncbi:unnamed protein product [Gongylonema pulchrum]|uniref:Phage tail fiber protein n=1 Tax=Gongylonema pulchrum TaxID=637853 RepID=A0A183DVT0_9BILA|nr:unnamed protein product [Gongylonema pulchrum]